MPNEHDDLVDQQLVARIEALPINAARRDEARAHFVHVERDIGEHLCSVAALIEGTAAMCRETLVRRRAGLVK